jgi:salicylate hydroxylase
MEKQILIVGGGIGGLAAALACTQAGWSVQLLERSKEFSEVGAGIQIGPNVVRVIRQWGLEKAFAQVAAFPDALLVRSAASGTELGVLPFGARTRQAYGAPYATVHRADLHKLLLLAVRQQPRVQLHLGQWLEKFEQDASGVNLRSLEGLSLRGDALVGADGLWSRVRQQLLNDGPPRVSGHLAYRAMVLQRDLPARLRSLHVTAWLGPRLHVVQYPVRKGNWMNVVGIVHGHLEGDLDEWDHATNAQDLRAAMVTTCSPLQDLIGAIENWRVWPLCDRSPMRGAHEQAQGHVALLGDAAHPMRPYMAQGAGMAIEDAACLQQVLTPPDGTMPQRLAAYAMQRWKRNARVQARSIRNGEIFHATGIMRWGRDIAMHMLGEKLLDVPWLYRGPDGRN